VCTASVDCNGECNGDAVFDACGTCGGSITDTTQCACPDGQVEDCEGTCGGTKVVDCDGACSGSAVDDECGVCGGSGPPTNYNCDGNYTNLDCAGVCGGGAVEDACGTCGGSIAEVSACGVDCTSTGENLNQYGLDCNGACGGSAVDDTCGVCGDTGPADNYNCQGECTAGVDCNGQCGGALLGTGDGIGNDQCGICGGGGPEEPEFTSIYSSTGKECDCIGNTWDCSGECGGNDDPIVSCSGWIDCDSTELHDGWCNSSSYACQETNCDEGDCGDWNGYQCVADAAIKYDLGSSNDDDHDYITDIHSTDPSIPSTFINDYYYPAIVGTYSYDFIIDWQSIEDEFVYGYYTTYNPINDHNTCFHLSMGVLGASFYEWYPWAAHIGENNAACATYYGYDDLLSREYSNSQTLSGNRLEEYNKQLEQYNRYLIDKEKEKYILYERGIIIGNIISNVTLTKIDNPLIDAHISEIDNNPNVIVQQENNYIMKYVKGKVPK